MRGEQFIAPLALTGLLAFGAACGEGGSDTPSTTPESTDVATEEWESYLTNSREDRIHAFKEIEADFKQMVERANTPWARTAYQYFTEHAVLGEPTLDKTLARPVEEQTLGDDDFLMIPALPVDAEIGNTYLGTLLEEHGAAYNADHDMLVVYSGSTTGRAASDFRGLITAHEVSHAQEDGAGKIAATQGDNLDPRACGASELTAFTREIETAYALDPTLEAQVQDLLAPKVRATYNSSTGELRVHWPPDTISEMPRTYLLDQAASQADRTVVTALLQLMAGFAAAKEVVPPANLQEASIGWLAATYCAADPEFSPTIPEQ